MGKGVSQAKGGIRTQILPMKGGEYFVIGKDKNGLRKLGTYQSLEAARKATEPFDCTLDMFREAVQEIPGMAFAGPNDIDQQRQRIRSELARKGYRLLHRRNGQYWVMKAQPMTLDQIEQTLAKL